MMSKSFHLLLTRVVMDRCPYDGKIWLDGGELETIQILVEQSMSLYALK
jgi:Zn-finger nucleic acid-binding protein